MPGTLDALAPKATWDVTRSGAFDRESVAESLCIASPAAMDGLSADRFDAHAMTPERFPLTREIGYLLPRTGPVAAAASFPASAAWPNEGISESVLESDALRNDPASRALLYRELGVREKTAAVDRFAALSHRASGPESETAAEWGEEAADRVVALPLPALVPAWLNGPEDEEDVENAGAERLPPPNDVSVKDTLQSSRARVASQRFALKSASLADEAVAAEAMAPTSSMPPSSLRVPLLAIFSLSGGVGKTSLAATLGRVLAGHGERVLLADTTSHGLLPHFFCATEPAFNAARTIRFPPEACAASMDLIHFDVRRQEDQSAQDWLGAELCRSSGSADRVLLDTSAYAPWVVRFLAGVNACVLVPLAPDINSVMTLDAVEDFFAETEDEFGQGVRPHYLLNGFEASQSLHLDVRELLRQRLGDRLLPFVIRRSAAIPEALAASMTVMDYAAGSAVAADYATVAEWVRMQCGGMLRAPQEALWSEV